MCVSSVATALRHKLSTAPPGIHQSGTEWSITPYCVIQNRAHDCEPILDNTITDQDIDNKLKPADIISDLKEKGFSKVYIACPQEVCDDPDSKVKEYHKRYSQQLAMGCFSDVRDPMASSWTDANSPPPASGNENARCKYPPIGGQECEKRNCKPD